MNDPETAVQFLSEATKRTNQSSGESQINVDKRMANCHYYLGFNELNFDSVDSAVVHFDQALELEVDRGDLLTNVVYSEALTMRSEYTSAKNVLDLVASKAEAKIGDANNKKKHVERT